jgi:hypothetical protein
VGGASAAPDRHSAAQRVTKVTSVGYSATVKFDRRDRPRVAALPGRSDVLGRSGRVRSSRVLPRASLARAAAGGTGYTCVNNRGRRGFVAYAPKPLTRDEDAYYIRFLFHLYKQNRARVLRSSRGLRRYRSKQWEACAVGGAHARGGNHLSRVLATMTMYSRADRLIGWKWGKGKELSTASASLKFAVPIKPVTVEGSVDVHPQNTFTGAQGPDQDAPEDFSDYLQNQVNTLWEGSHTFRWQGSTHFEGNVGHALWELRQRAPTPSIRVGENLRKFCGHPFGIGCA